MGFADVFEGVKGFLKLFLKAEDDFSSIRSCKVDRIFNISKGKTSCFFKKN
jgi:hypothetical protein